MRTCKSCKYFNGCGGCKPANSCSGYEHKGKVNNVVRVLMERDGMTETEALQAVYNTKEDLELGYSDAIQYNLCLEDDYIFDILDI